MEFVEGEPIDVFCADRALPLRERLAVFRQVCAAVQHAHQHLVIHRDIKADNILVTADGTPKLLDFGIARLLDPQTGLQSGAHTTVRVMTPESASPEQVVRWRGDRRRRRVRAGRAPVPAADRTRALSPAPRAPRRK